MLVDTFSCFQTCMLVEFYASRAVTQTLTVWMAILRKLPERKQTRT